MSKIMVSVADATLPQLIAFAEASLGLPTPPANIGLETMRAKVRNVWDRPDFELSVDSAPDMTGRPPDGEFVAVPKRTSGQNDPKVRIILAKHERPGGDRAEFLAVNGVSILIPRGEPCDIPYRYYEVLLNAVETHRIEDGHGNVSMRSVPAFQYNVLAMPDPRAVEDYIARNAKAVAYA